MTIYEFAEIISCDVVVKYVPRACAKWIADLCGYNKTGNHYGSYMYKDTSLDCILKGKCGYGETPEQAIQQLVSKIKGKYVVAKEVVPVPLTLEA